MTEAHLKDAGLLLEVVYVVRRRRYLVRRREL